MERFRTAWFALPALLIGAFGWAFRWVCDDAFIVFRVADHLVRGNGLVFNEGERVEASTTPLWTVILAAVHAVGGPIEWASVVLGLGAAVGALVLASRLGREDGRWPLGLLVFAVLPPAWHYATSGLEMGLAFLVIAATPWLITRGRWISGAFVASLMPLIRPDLGLFWLPFLVLAAIRFRRSGASVGRTVGLVAAGTAVPVLWQIFRMGYYLALTPNTAIAKSAGGSDWAQGLTYLVDLGEPYALWWPLAALLLLGIIGGFSKTHRTERIVLAVCGVLHATYITRVGGDFMHGRLLLPGLFAVLIAAPGVRLPEPSGARIATGVLGLGALAWAVLCASMLRLDRGQELNSGIADERAWYVIEAHADNPITLEDYTPATAVQIGWLMRATAEGSAPNGVSPLSCPGGLVLWVVPDGVLRPTCHPLNRLAVGPGIEVAVNTDGAGRFSYAAGPRVHVIDRRGLGDPIASRLERDTVSRIGHRKLMEEPWIIARFGAPGYGDNVPEVAAARRVLTCPGPLHDLIAGITSPSVFGMFGVNLSRAAGFQMLRIDNDPVVAAGELCPSIDLVH